MQAWELYHAIQRHGQEVVMALQRLDLSDIDAETLYLRLDWLTEHWPAYAQTFFGVPKEDT